MQLLFLIQRFTVKSRGFTKVLKVKSVFFKTALSSHS